MKKSIEIDENINIDKKSALIEISILIKKSILINISILLCPPPPPPPPIWWFWYLNFGVPKRNLENWWRNQSHTKGKVKCSTKLSCGMVAKRKTWRSSQSALCDETKILTDTETETFYPRQIFPIPIPRLFFRDQIFRDRYRDFFNETKFFDTDTKTFFRDQNFWYRYRDS